MTLTDEGKPQISEEAMVDNHKVEWEKAIEEEMKSLHENHIYDLWNCLKEERTCKTNGESELINRLRIIFGDFLLPLLRPINLRGPPSSRFVKIKFNGHCTILQE